MPWEITKRDGKFCVIKSGTNTSEGCHSTRSEAVDQMRALYASESSMAAVSFNLSDVEDAVYHLKLALGLQAGILDGSIALSRESTEELNVHIEEALAALGEYELIEEDITLANEEFDGPEPFTFDTTEFKEYAWTGPIVFEDVLTGDNRIFNKESIIWEEETLPWSFRWQKASGQGHAGSVPVGRVDRIERKEDGKIHGFGVVIPGLSDEAAQYLKLLKTGVGGGVSVDGDSAQFEVQEMADGSPRYEFSSMRLRALSAVDIPAFNGARIHLVEDVVEASTEEVVESVEVSEIVEASIEASTENESEVIEDSIETVDLEALETDSETLETETILESLGAAAIEIDTIPAGLLKYLPVVETGATPVEIGFFEIEDGRQGDYQHPSAEVIELPEAIEVGESNYFRDGMANGWYSDGLVASAIPVLPSIEAFVDPEFDQPTALSITKDGRVSGHLALFNTCHIGFPGACVKPPKGSKYQYFHTGEIETSEGDLVSVGHLTFNIGHADMNMSPKAAADHYKAAHYDNVQTVAADVRAGEDQHGIWVVGALRSHLSDEDIRAFRSAPLSGDWRRISGRLELVGALAVNVPGFPVPRGKTRVKALVASGETKTLLTFLEEDDDNFVSEYELGLRLNKKASLAARIGNEPLVSETNEFAQSLDDFLSEDVEEVPEGDAVFDVELEELPNKPTKKEIDKIVKSYDQKQLLHDLKDMRDLLDDPNETISKKDREALEAVYALFVATKNGKKVDAAGMDIEEFYNQCHGQDGKFCPTQGGRGSGGGKGKGVTGRHTLPGNPHEPGKGGREVGDSEHRHVTAPSGDRKNDGNRDGNKGNRDRNKGDKGGFNDRDREQAVRQLQSYRTAKISARRWAITSGIAGAALGAINGGLPLISIVGPISPLLANPAVLTGLAGLGLFNAGKKLLAAKDSRRDFSSTIDRINKRQRIDEQIRRLNQSKP